MQTLVEHDDSPVTESATALQAVLSGTFHRSREALRETFDALSSSYTLLSPAATTWVDPEQEFVRLPTELGSTPESIEAKHLAAIGNADFVWLFCPDGYVGTSAAMEIGYAGALGVPVVTDTVPSEESFAGLVHVVKDVSTAPEALAYDPGRPLDSLQRYYRRTAQRRGWADESAKDVMLLLTEELGELAGPYASMRDWLVMVTSVTNPSVLSLLTCSCIWCT